MRNLFNYCFYRIAKAYRILDEKNYCSWGYGVMFATFSFIFLAITTWILHVFQHELTETIIIIVVIPFILLDALFSIFLNNEKKYIQLDNYYKNEKYSQLKGWLVFLYIVGSFVLYIVSMLLCGYWVDVNI